MEIQSAVAPSEHVVDNVEEDRRDHDPAEDDAELDFPGEELEGAKGQVEDDRAGQI